MYPPLIVPFKLSYAIIDILGVRGFTLALTSENVALTSKAVVNHRTSYNFQILIHNLGVRLCRQLKM